jgi:hypothetical protein
VRIRADQVIAFNERLNADTSRFEVEYYGKYLYRDRKDNLVFGLCAPKWVALKYKVNSEIEISYMDMDVKEKYKVSVRVLTVSNVSEDAFEIEQTMANELKENFEVDRYVLAVTALSKPVLNTQREFFRLPVEMEIYYREIEAGDIDKMNEKLRLEVKSARTHKKEADAGILEEEAGYFKIITADISAGGFMFKSAESMEEQYMECMMIVDMEALPAIAKILRSREDKKFPGGYIVHVQFCRINEAVRDRLVRHLLNLQRQQQHRYLRR